jgi:hypothetical protein
MAVGSGGHFRCLSPPFLVLEIAISASKGMAGGVGVGDG